MESRENSILNKDFETLKNSKLWRYLSAIAEDDDLCDFYTRCLFFNDKTSESDKAKILLKPLKQIKLSDLCEKLSNKFPHEHPYKQKFTVEYLRGVAKNILDILSPDQKTLDEIVWENFWQSSVEEDKSKVFLLCKEMESIFAIIQSILHLPQSFQQPNARLSTVDCINIIAGNSEANLYLTSKELIFINNYCIELLPRLIYLISNKDLVSEQEKAHIQAMLKGLSIADWISYLIHIHAHPYKTNYAEFKEALQFAMTKKVIDLREDVSQELLKIASQLEISPAWEIALSYALRSDLLIEQLKDHELIELMTYLTKQRFILVVSYDKFKSLMERVDLKLFFALLEKKQYPFLEIMLAQSKFLAKLSWEEIRELQELPQENYSKLFGFPSFADKLNKVTDENQKREILRELAYDKLFIAEEVLKHYAKHLKSEDLESIKKAHPGQLRTDFLKKTSEVIKNEENKKLTVSEDKLKPKKEKSKEKSKEANKGISKENRSSLKPNLFNKFFSKTSKEEKKKCQDDSLGKGCGRG